MKLDKYSFGIGDRFGQQGIAQLRALKMAKENGIEIIPVWNKSFREHKTIKSSPLDVRKEADNAVKNLGWTENYFVDADHINLTNIDEFILPSDFFTIDVADYIGKPSDKKDVDEFIKNNKNYIGQLNIPEIEIPFNISDESLRLIAKKFLFPAKQASKIFNYIKNIKGETNFVSEVSMDEIDEPQSPVELLFILSALSQFNVPVQTIAPKFTGRFNKGVDYVGDINQFAKEFEEDLLVIDFAIKEFKLPENLKLSIHSGSDKFAIYPIMGKLINKYNKGIHIKTAGTTWLEEIIGLSLVGGDALNMAQNIYEKAYERSHELCAPYATVIDINTLKLPTPKEVYSWNSYKFASTLQHNTGNLNYNANFRQLIHVGYKVAAELGDKYINMLRDHNEIVGQQVTNNIYERHIKKLFNL